MGIPDFDLVWTLWVCAVDRRGLSRFKSALLLTCYLFIITYPSVCPSHIDRQNLNYFKKIINHSCGPYLTVETRLVPVDPLSEWKTATCRNYVASNGIRRMLCTISRKIEYFSNASAFMVCHITYGVLVHIALWYVFICKLHRSHCMSLFSLSSNLFCHFYTKKIFRSPSSE